MERKIHLPTILASMAYFMNTLQVCQGAASEELHQLFKREDDNFNYTGLWISNGVMLMFVSLIVLYGLYKSYIGEVHMPVRRIPPSKKDETDANTDEGGELSAVNPAFINDQDQPSAATQTDFPEEIK